MTWRIARILCGAMIALVLASMALLFASHGRPLPMRVAGVVLHGAALPGLAAALIAVQLRRREWKGRPEYARQLQFAAAWPPLLGVALLVAVGTMFL